MTPFRTSRNPSRNASNVRKPFTPGDGFPMPWEVAIPREDGRVEDPKRTRLGKILRYLNKEDEEKYPNIEPKDMRISKHYDGLQRLKNPFEHVCGGNADYYNKSAGNDGPSNFISFSNPNFNREANKDCALYYDKGQRRAKYLPSAGRGSSIVIDVSSYEKALSWCYHGGRAESRRHEIQFHGAKDITPFPFLCATSAYQTHLRCRLCGQPPVSWWTPDNRKLIAHKCAEWAMTSMEVLVMPDPDRIMDGEHKNWVEVETDRAPARNGCFAHLKDKCVNYDWKSKTVCCCSDRSCSREECPGGVTT